MCPDLEKGKHSTSKSLPGARSILRVGGGGLTGQTSRESWQTKLGEQITARSLQTKRPESSGSSYFGKVRGARGGGPGEVFSKLEGLKSGHAPPPPSIPPLHPPWAGSHQSKVCLDVSEEPNDPQLGAGTDFYTDSRFNLGTPTQTCLLSEN